MILGRIRTTLTMFFVMEVISYFLSFSLWYFLLFGDNGFFRSLGPASDAYVNQAIIFAFFLFFSYIISAYTHLQYELKQFSAYAITSYLRYFYRSAVASALITVFWSIIGLLFFHALSMVKVFSIYAISLCIVLALHWMTTKILTNLYTADHNIRQVLVVGINKHSKEFIELICNNKNLGINIIGQVDTESREDLASTYLGDFSKIEEMLRLSSVDAIAIFLPIRSFYDVSQEIFRRAEYYGVVVYCMPNSFEQRQTPLHFHNIESLHTVEYSSTPDDMVKLAIKRTMDIVLVSGALLVGFPFLLGIALYIRFTAGAPIFFTQQRIGYNKRIFHLYKFRTMVPDAEKQLETLAKLNEMDGAAFKITNDPRLIKGAAFLRRYSLDELPQLWNILCGDMSIVGPRPLSLRDYQKLPDDWQRRRFSVPPGLTCIWQVSGRNNVSFEEWMHMDLQYIDSWSLRGDIVLIMKTFREVFRGGGK